VNFDRKTNFQVIQKGVHLFKNCKILSVNIPAAAKKEIDFGLITNPGEDNTYPIQNKPVYYYSVRENDLETAERRCAEIEDSITIET